MIRMRRSRRRLTLLAALVLAVLVALVAVEPFRWRATLVAIKASGKLPDVRWGELFRMLPPRGPVSLRPLVITRNPFLSLQHSDTGAVARASGGELYRRHCAHCHAMDGSGAGGPDLTGALGHGATDWSLFQAVSRGFPAQGMPALKLSDSQRWLLVGYLQYLRGIRASAPVATADLSPPRPIGADELVAARADSGNWLTYSGAYDGRRYSLLSQINRSNVGRLRLLWMHQIGGAERFESTPLVVDGRIYFTTPGIGVRALDAETGALLWSYQPPRPSPVSHCCGEVNRGLALLGTTLYLATVDAMLVALDARTGKVRWKVRAAEPGTGYAFTSAPLAVNDLVLVGSAGGDFPTRGFIDAYDAETGVRRWRFHTVPAAGLPGNETWSGDSWKTGGGAPWLTGSYDPGLGLVYWGVGNPNPDFNGDGRLGDNLYTNSVVALAPETGALRWHFQFTPHDEHDWDAAQTPVLIDSAGVPLLAWANRNGFYYVLHRGSGAFHRARAFARQTWAVGIEANGRPIVRPGSAPTRGGTVTAPAAEGATNWWSPSYSPRTGLFYVPTLDRADLIVKGDPEERGLRWGTERNPSGVEPGDGWIRALDAMTGELRWEYHTFRTTDWYVHHVGGLLSTASDLLFGASEDRFLALDATDGHLLWSFRAGEGIHAGPVTYLSRGRQRITVAAGRALLTFGLE